jgi:hypothetical protein
MRPSIALKLTTLFAFALTTSAANAGLVTLEFNNGDSLTNWTVDRAAPAGFQILNNELVMTIDGNNHPDSRGGFYDTKGMQLDIGNANYLSVDMFIPNAWDGSERYGGLWGIGQDGNGNTSGWPILEFQGPKAGNAAGINTWDNSGWSNNISTLFNYDAFNTLELAITGSGVEYSLNGNLLYTDTSGDVQSLGGVILNAKNEGSSFKVRYDNLTYGTVPEPGTLAMLGLGLAGLGWSRRRSARTR